MKLLGFCDYYSEVIKYKEKEYVVKDIRDEIYYCRKSSPTMITFNQLKSMSEEEQHKAIEQKTKEWQEYQKNPWGDGFEEEGKELEKVWKELWDFLEKEFIKKTWRYPGWAYQDEWVPVIEDDKGRIWKIRTSQRVWGDFIHRVECTRNGTKPDEEKGYLEWYLYSGKNNSVKPIYPRKNWVLETVEYEREDEII